MRHAIILAALLATATAAHGQQQRMTEKQIVAEAFRLARLAVACSENPSGLIGLSSDALRAKCSEWNNVNVTTTAAGKSAQLIYNKGGVVFYVYTDNDIVTAVQSR